MIFNKIWEKYFLRETLKLFLLFIVSFYALYVLIDYSSHSRTFHHYVQFKWYQIVLYYLCEFSHRLDILLPFALLIATIRTLCTMNVHNELVALMAGGYSLKKLMTPFIFIGLIFVSVEYANYQFIMPKALKELRKLDETRTVEKNKDQKIQSVQSLTLEDRSTLVYINYDLSNQRFYDAYWIRSIDDIYRIKYLYPYEKVPLGKVVEHIERNKDGHLQEVQSHIQYAFHEMKFNRKKLLETLTPPDENQISGLWKKFPEQKKAMSEKQAILISTLYRKMLMPWLALLAVIGPAPFCIRYNRHQPVFLIYAWSLFGLVAAYLVLDSSVLLGKRQVLPPEWAIFPPFFFLSGIIGWNFCRIK